MLLDKGIVVIQSGAVCFKPLRAPLLSARVSEFLFKCGGQINLQDFGLSQQVTVDADIRRCFGGICVVEITHWSRELLSVSHKRCAYCMRMSYAREHRGGESVVPETVTTTY